jgi:hypothetical protein
MELGNNNYEDNFTNYFKYRKQCCHIVRSGVHKRKFFFIRANNFFSVRPVSLVRLIVRILIF